MSLGNQAVGLRLRVERGVLSGEVEVGTEQTGPGVTGDLMAGRQSRDPAEVTSPLLLWCWP